jgi:hypothetical protein
MQKIRLLCAFVGIVCVGLVAIPAFADIKAFNAAIKAGDYKAAATEAKSTWASWDKSDPDTATVAREFGFAAYVAGDYATAREFGQFLKDNGSVLPTPDDQPVLSAVLLTAAEFRLDSGKRQPLVDALKSREAIAGLDMQSALAAEALYHGDWASGKWGAADDSAALADRLLSRGGTQLIVRALEARATAAVAGFMSGRNKQDYARIVTAHNDVVDALDKTLDPRQRKSLIPLKFRLEAWASSVASYFSATQQTGSLISKNVRPLELKSTERPLFDEAFTGPDSCEGDMNIGSLRYPLAAEFRGMVGTVIMRYDSDAQGRITKHEILAAVPVAQFAAEVDKAADSFQLKRAPTDKPGCTLANASRIVRLLFYIL